MRVARFALVSSLALLSPLLGCVGLNGPVATLRGPEGELERLTSGPFFIQMSDPQLGFSNTPVLIQLLGITFDDDPSQTETELFERAIAHANELRPAFVVICGDLINVPMHPVQTAEFRRIAAQLDDDIPLHLVAGNHDVGNDPTPESLRWYRETFGPDWYAFRHGDVYGIVLDSPLIDRPWNAQEDAEAQLDWLEEELARAFESDARYILVFQHHPFFLEDPEEDDAYFNLPTLARRTFLKRLHDGRVDAVLAGHYHRNGYATDGPLEMIITGPVGKPLGDDPSGFRIVRVGRGGLAHGYFGIAEAP